LYNIKAVTPKTLTSAEKSMWAAIAKDRISVQVEFVGGVVGGIAASKKAELGALDLVTDKFSGSDETTVSVDGKNMKNTTTVSMGAGGSGTLNFWLLPAGSFRFPSVTFDYCVV
jgi:hypothetical protein